MPSQSKYRIEDIPELIEDRQKFDNFVYTNIDDAIVELKKRRQDIALTKKVSELLNGDTPELLRRDPIRAVLFRQITTPNYEIRRFYNIVDALDDLEPMFAEYRDDKFVSKNDHKHSWGKIIFHKKHGEKPESLTVINLVEADGEKLSSIHTNWGQLLLDFHHELFVKTFRPLKPDNVFDISSWLKAHGGSAKNYYMPIMLWFIQGAILFDNFMPGETKETAFTREVFLPAFIKAYELTGFKPIIVNLLPTMIENDKFWYCHPLSSKEYIESKMKVHS